MQFECLRVEPAAWKAVAVSGSWLAAVQGRYGWFHCSEQPQEREDESRGSGALTSSLVLLDLKERFPNPKRWLTARNKTQCINILVFQKAPQSPAVMLIECDLYQGE